MPENIFDYMILVLLCVAVGYCIVLNYRLGQFKSVKEEMQHLLRRFRSETKEIEEELSSVQKQVQENIVHIHVETQKAALVRDDLALVLDKINHQQEAPFVPEERAIKKEDFQGAVIDQDASESEKELIAALRKM